MPGFAKWWRAPNGTDAPAGPTYPLDGANSPPTWTIVFYLLRKGVKPPVLVLCLAFRHRKVRLYYIVIRFISSIAA